jgi:predicted secreted protein
VFCCYLSTDEKAISDNKQDITSAESVRLFTMLPIVSNGNWSSDGVLGSTNLTFQHPILHRRTTTTTTTTPLLLLLLYYLLTTSPTAAAAAAGLGDGRRED